MEVELEKGIERIREKNAETVLLQMPEGLKSRALSWADRIESETNAEVFIWAGTCYGACDIPKVDVDLLIHIGHTPLGI